jgi:2-polyprenyl-3-methyl-5-hydroxy-6-metoxy-1,4-benzoquinol methylase
MAIGTRFSFGTNWLDYIENSLDKRKVDGALQSLRTMLNCNELTGKTFLDVGCGSGLFSLAACLLDADHVSSFDYDTNSVLASKKLRERFNIPDHKWEIQKGDVLDKKWLASLQQADIVYSWGVLHHTGAMWAAIDNTISKVKPGGLLAISIYNRVDTPRDSSKMWWKIKRFYNQSSNLVKNILVYLFILKVILGHIRRGKNPIKEIKAYGERGMDFLHDARDWVGGFPYEYAYAEEVIDHIGKYQQFKLIFVNEVSGNACNEFTFKYSE